MGTDRFGTEPTTKQWRDRTKTWASMELGQKQHLSSDWMQTKLTTSTALWANHYLGADGIGRETTLEQGQQQELVVRGLGPTPEQWCDWDRTNFWAMMGLGQGQELDCDGSGTETTPGWDQRKARIGQDQTFTVVAFMGLGQSRHLGSYETGTVAECKIKNTDSTMTRWNSCREQRRTAVLAESVAWHVFSLKYF